MTVIVTAKHEGGLLGRAQLQQAGLYQLPPSDETQKQRAIHGFCANQLYSYAQVYLSTLVQQRGFPPVILVPVDFWHAYQEHLKKVASAEVKKPATLAH